MNQAWLDHVTFTVSTTFSYSSLYQCGIGHDALATVEFATFSFFDKHEPFGAICVVSKHFNLILIFFCQSQAFGEVTKHFNLI
jgi:hypothetical protein